MADEPSTVAVASSVDVEHLPELEAAQSQLGALRQMAERVDVKDEVSAATAAELAGQIARARREAEANRKSLVDPLNGVVRKINAAAKQTIEPLQEMERVVKGKIATWQAAERERLEAERRRAAEAAERARREEEERRRRAEDEARQAREAAAREAARAEEEARNAERARLEQLQAEKDARRKLVGELPDAALQMLAGNDESPSQEAARAELEARRAARTAQERVAAAREAEEQARAAERAAREEPQLPIVAPSVPEAVGPVRAGGVAVSTSQRWTYEVQDLAKVPTKYLELNRGEVRRAVNAGERSIPGLRIFQQDVGTVRTS